MVEHLLRPLVKKGVRSLEVKEEAEDAYNVRSTVSSLTTADSLCVQKEIQDRLMASVFSQCNSWVSFFQSRPAPGSRYLSTGMAWMVKSRLPNLDYGSSSGIVLARQTTGTTSRQAVNHSRTLHLLSRNSHCLLLLVQLL